MNKVEEIARKYSAGEITIEEANEKLKELKAGLHFDENKNVITEEEKMATTIGYYPCQANGFGLLDTATGSLDKVEIVNGKTKYPVNTVIDGKPNMPAYVYIAGKVYSVHGDVLVEEEE